MFGDLLFHNMISFLIKEMSQGSIGVRELNLLKFRFTLNLRAAEYVH